MVKKISGDSSAGKEKQVLPKLDKADPEPQKKPQKSSQESAEIKPPRISRKKILSVAGWILWIVAAYFLANFVMAIMLLFLQHYNLFSMKNPSVIATFLINAAMYALMFAIAVLLPIWRKKRKAANDEKGEFGLKSVLSQVGLSRWPKLIDLSYFAANTPVFYVVNMLAAVVAAYLLGSQIMGQEQTLSFAADGNSLGKLVVIFTTYVIVAPLFEEMLMRGFLFKKIRRNLPFWPTAIIVSLLFAVAHGQINVGLMTFIMSMFCCRIREKTGAIWGGVFLHAFSNGVAFLLLFVA